MGSNSGVVMFTKAVVTQFKGAAGAVPAARAATIITVISITTAVGVEFG